MKNKIKLVGINLVTITAILVLANCNSNSSKVSENHAPDIEWVKGFGNPDGGHVHHGMQTSDGGYIAVGNSSIGEENYVGLIIKVDSLGNKEWYTGDFEFIQNFAFNCRFRFEVTAMYNWWGEVESHANVFYNVEGEEYGEGNLCLNYGNHDPREADLDHYKVMAELLSSGQFVGPETLPGENDIIAALNQTISELE
jgi:hypothetical protein